MRKRISGFAVAMFALVPSISYSAETVDVVQGHAREAIRFALKVKVELGANAIQDDTVEYNFGNGLYSTESLRGYETRAMEAAKKDAENKCTAKGGKPEKHSLLDKIGLRFSGQNTYDWHNFQIHHGFKPAENEYFSDVTYEIHCVIPVLSEGSSDSVEPSSTFGVGPGA